MNGSSSDTTVKAQKEKEMENIDEPGIHNQSRGFFDRSEGSVLYPLLPYGMVWYI